MVCWICGQRMWYVFNCLKKLYRRLLGSREHITALEIITLLSYRFISMNENVNFFEASVMHVTEISYCMHNTYDICVTFLTIDAG